MDRSRRELLAGCSSTARHVPVRQARPFLAALLTLLAALLAWSPGSALAASESLPRTILPGSPEVRSLSVAPGPVEQWIVASVPGAESRTIAAVHGADPLSGPGQSWVIGTAQATAFAGDLDRRGLLLHAEPDVPVTSAGYPEDRLADFQWWLPMIVDVANTTPPKVTPSSPELALIELSADPLHPDLAEAKLEDPAPIGPEEDLHGTIVAAVAGSPGEGEGIRGVWPGMRMRLFSQGETCSSVTEAVYDAARAKSPVINMSYGFPSDSCFIHYQATELAVHRGSIPVAASGNTFLRENNLAMRPATDPHVISVSAVDAKGAIAEFATRNPQVDLTAPGVDLLVPNISASNGDGNAVRDHDYSSGTSFSTPMVSAAAAWMRQARSNLSARQVSRLLTASATDLLPKGWDSNNGAGLLNINAALREPAPPDDPKEPNDDIGWIDGSLLRNGKQRIVAPLLYRPGFESRELVRATLSTRDDPVDVYRMRIGREATVVFRIDQLAGDVAVQTFEGGVQSVTTVNRAFAASDRKPPNPEGIKVTNRSRKALNFYLAIKPGRTQSGTYSRYRVTVQSIR